MVKRSGFALGAVAGTAFGLAAAHTALPPAVAVPPAATPAVAATPATPAADGPAVREFKIVGTDYRGVKRWEPATLICYQGERIKLTIINRIPAEPPTHGFTIAAFGIKEEVLTNTEKVVEFTADKPGLHTINCHLHPKHIGGQLLVLTK